MGNGKSKGKEMPYRQVKKKGYKNVTYSRNVVNESRLGYTEIPIHRPKFIFFEFQGLRANIPHWIFFGNVLVNKWCNTSFSLSDYTSAARTSKIKEPGDTYVNATSFPAAQGGPTNGGDNTELVSAADGSLKGLFYLQSNVSLNFPTNTDGTNFSALDVSVMDRDEALSYAATKFYGMGQYEDWYEHTTTEYETRREKYYYYETVYYDREHGRDGDYGGGHTSFSGSISTSSTTSTPADPTYGDYTGGGSGSYGISVGVSAVSTESYGDGRQNTGDWGCFVADTPIDMADGTQKAIVDLRLGDLTKGGVVQGIHVYGGAPLYEYNGVRVSGTHYVIENDRAIMVKDTSIAIKVPDVYGLYTIDTSDRRIFSNGIEFADHNGDGIIIDFFNNMKKDAPILEIENQISAAML